MMNSEMQLRINRIWNTPRLSDSSRTAIICSRNEAIIPPIQPAARIRVSPGSRAVMARFRRAFVP